MKLPLAFQLVALLQGSITADNFENLEMAPT